MGSSNSCQGIADIALKNLGQSLKKSTSIQNLYIDLSSCDKITDQGFNDLNQGIQNLPFLQKLSLDLRE